MGQHALIADQDPARAAVYAGILKQEGYHAVVVKDAAGAISALLERGTPALAVIDLALGFGLIERLRRAAPAAALPIVAVSGLRTERDLATTHRVRLGLGAILAKAASDDSFRRVIRNLLGITASDDPEAAAAAPGAVITPAETENRAESGVRIKKDPGATAEQENQEAPGSPRVARGLGSRR